MEIFYDYLREVCTCFLLSFLVVRLISLIVSSSDDDKFDDSICGFISSGTMEKTQVEFDDLKVINEVNSLDDDNPENYNSEKSIEKGKLIVGFEEFDSSYDEFDDSICGFISSGSINQYKHLDCEEVFGGQEKTQIKFNALKVINEVNSLDDEKSIEKGKIIVGYEDIDVVDHVKEGIFHDMGLNLGEGGGDDVREGDDSSNVTKGEVSGREFDVDEGDLSDDEEWEGIERSELERNFARAMNLVGCKDKQELLVAKVGSDVMMKFYGLQKIAMEGPCHEAQPLAIKRSARAKWNAWQKLGSMTREDAMEQYISLLLDNIPEWLDEHSSSLMAEWKSRSSRTALDSSLEVN